MDHSETHNKTNTILSIIWNLKLRHHRMFWLTPQHYSAEMTHSNVNIRNKINAKYNIFCSFRAYCISDTNNLK